MLGNDHFKPFPNIAKLLYHKNNNTVYHFSNIQCLLSTYDYRIIIFVTDWTTGQSTPATGQIIHVISHLPVRNEAAR